MSKFTDAHRLDLAHEGIEQALKQAKEVREQLHKQQKKIVANWKDGATGKTPYA